MAESPVLRNFSFNRLTQQGTFGVFSQRTLRADFNNGAHTDDDIVDVFTQRITTPLHIYKNVLFLTNLPVH